MEIKIGIYKITSPTNKIYIGESINILERWRHYFNLDCKRQVKLFYSLQKHGPENHKFEILEECTEDKLLERETYWKIFYKVLDIPSLCCRLDGKAGRCSEETKEKIRQGRIGKKHSKETCKKISEFRKNVKELTPWFLKPINQYDLQGNFIKEWGSARDAGKELQVSSINIRANARGKQKTAYGFKWEYKK